MLPHFKSVVRLYFQDEIKGHNPISETDARIFSLIINLLDSFPSARPLKYILDAYKSKSDINVLTELKELQEFVRSPDFKQSPDEEGGSDKKSNIFFTEIKGDLYFSTKINSLQREHRFEEDEECTIYYIVINKTDATNQPFYANTYIPYYTKHKRDEDFNRIKTNLINQANVAII